MKEYKLDLHNHTSTFSGIIGKRQDPQQYVEKLLGTLFKKQGNIILGIADFDSDNRYKKFLNILRKFPEEYVLDKQYKDYLK